MFAVKIYVLISVGNITEINDKRSRLKTLIKEILKKIKYSPPIFDKRLPGQGKDDLHLNLSG